MFSGTGWDTIIYHPQILLCTVPVFCKLFSFEDFKYFCRIRIGLASNTATSQYSTCTWLFSHYSTFLFSHHSTWLFFHHNTWLFLPSQFLVLKFSPLGGCTQCCGAGRSRGFLAGAWADLKFELEPELIFLGRQVKNKKMLFFIVYSTYFCIINSTCWLYLQLKYT